MESELAELELKNIAVTRVSDTMIQCLFRTPRIKQLYLYITAGERYPQEPILVDISCSQLNSTLIEKMAKLLNQEASKTAPEIHIVKIADKLASTLNENKLLAAWAELTDARKCLGTNEELQTLGKLGAFVLKLRENEWEMSIKVKVPDDYPYEPLDFSITSTNLPPSMVDMFRNQASNLIYKCIYGEKVVTKSAEQSLTAEQIRHDVDFLRTKHLLEQKSAQKEARRQHNRIIKKEIEKEKEILASQQDLIESIVTPSIPPFIHFWTSEIFRRIPSETCQRCQETIINSKDPERVVCGHWFHMKCLEEYMRTPPFEKYCLACNERVFHPKFPTDPKALERLAKAWSMDQARRREIADVVDFLDM